MTDILAKLPKELQTNIWEYDPEHRVKLNEVLDELDYVVNWTYCASEMCEMSIHKLDNCTIKSSPLPMLKYSECYFCSKDCESYGTWSKRYDYRKSMRR
jgi:hypothetical protein